MKTKTRSTRRPPKLGQHFLNNPTVAESLVDAAGVKEGTEVVEIGPGTGALTKVLLKRGARVVAIEKDTELIAKLNGTFKSEIESGQLTILEKDVRDVAVETLPLGEEYVLAANIPYYITGEIIRHFLTTNKQPQTLALLMQKEVADRIVARDRKESILSLSVKAYGEPRITRKVPPGNFTPPPSVDSAILAVLNVSKRFFDGISEERFFQVVKAGFSSKRKLLVKNIASLVPKEKSLAVLLTHQLPETARAEDLSLAVWKELVR